MVLGTPSPYPRHDIHPDTLKQIPTTPGRDKSGEALRGSARPGRGHVPARLNLKQLVSVLSRSNFKPRGFKVVEIAANPKLLDKTKLEAGLNASLELQCRETMAIRTKHLRACFEAGLQKWTSPVQDSSCSWCWSNQLQLEINASTNLPQ